MYHRTLSRQNLQRFQGRAQKCWNELPTLRNLRTGLQERLQDKSDAPAEMRENLPRISFKLKKEDKSTFHSPDEEWTLLAASTINSEEREFVVDSRANMHMVNKKHFDKAELETVRISKNPIMVVTANGEVPAKEEAAVYVRELDLFVTVMLLENTPAVLSLGKLCGEFGYSYHWTSGQKPHLIKNGKKFHRDTSKHVPFVVPGLSTSSSSSSTFPTCSSKETVTDTENPATRRSESTKESARVNPSHESQSDELQGVPEWVAGVPARAGR